MSVHEGLPFVGGHRIETAAGHGFEVVFAWPAGGEREEHLGVVAASEAMPPARRNIEVVAGCGIDPILTVM